MRVERCRQDHQGQLTAQYCLYAVEGRGPIVPFPGLAALDPAQFPEANPRGTGSSINSHLLGPLSDHPFLCLQEAGCWHGCYGYRPGG